MTAKDKKEILQIFSEAFEKTVMPVLKRIQGNIKSLDKRVGSLEKRVEVLEQKMDAHAAEQILMHKKIDILLNGWQAHKEKLEDHEERISFLETGCARPSL